MNAKLILSLMLLSSAIDAQPKASAKKTQARSSERHSRSVSRRLAAIEPEKAARTNSACDVCQKEYNELLAELSKARTSKEFREGNEVARTKAIQCESRANQKLRELMDIATNGNSQAGDAA